MITSTSSCSTRGEPGTVEVVARFWFTGPEVTVEAVREHFTASAVPQTAEMAKAAADLINRLHDEEETAVQTALSEALAMVDPSHHNALVERFGLTR